MRSLVFDTADKQNITHTGNSQYTLYFNQVIECHKIVITNIIIPHSFYNVNYNNNRIIVNDELYLIPVGCYTVQDLMEYLIELFTKLLPVEIIVRPDDVKTSFTYNKKTLKTELGIKRFNEIIGADFNTYADNLYEIKFDTCYELFGFRKGDEYNFGENGILVSPNVCNIVSIPAVYLRSNALHTHFIYNNSITSILFRMPVNKQFGEYLIHVDYTTDIYLTVQNLTHLDIRLTDYANNDIDLNGLDFKVEFSIE